MEEDYVYTSEIRESLEDIFAPRLLSTYHHLITASSQKSLDTKHHILLARFVSGGRGKDDS